ncbi:restriction endonuclease [Uliginosibacterium gangwonense]|uniref:restriction endonuclease n=1 Tax=Uliginosibacterium gangwonense TaxID=392736 RepID=UPI00036E2676|nr:restriction endonuclease [Uliginosibacterium gangwonense]
MVGEDKENREGESTLLPLGVLGRNAQAVAWRALGVFIVGYVLPVWVLGRSSLAGSIQWATVILSYLLFSLMVFRFLEQRDVEPEEEGLDGSEVAPPAGALDEVLPQETTPAKVHRPDTWSPDLLHSLDWQRMLELCVAFFSDRFRCKPGKLGEDGSVDIRLFKGEETLPVAIVHCRAWGEHEIGLDSLERLSALMAAEFVTKGFFMGYGGFSSQAREYAKVHSITLIDDVMFIAMLMRQPEARRQQLLDIAVQGDFTTPSCPVCGLKMLSRQNEQARYWGCRAYPRCKGVLAMRPKRVPRVVPQAPARNER